MEAPAKCTHVVCACKCAGSLETTFDLESLKRCAMGHAQCAMGDAHSITQLKQKRRLPFEFASENIICLVLNCTGAFDGWALIVSSTSCVIWIKAAIYATSKLTPGLNCAKVSHPL